VFVEVEFSDGFPLERDRHLRGFLTVYRGEDEKIEPCAARETGQRYSTFLKKAF
jgi:hypothetical protein